MATRAMTIKQWEENQRKYGRTTEARPQFVAAAKQRSKYGNVKTVVDGVKMDSKREGKRYSELGLLLKGHKIHWLARQVRFILPGGVEYVADFVYGRVMGALGIGSTITVEDAKGVRTPEYKIKAKLMKSEYGIDVVEV